MLIAGCLAAPAAVARPASVVPVFNSSYADSGVEPTRFSPIFVIGELAENDLNNYVRNVHWSSWGDNEALGRGEVSLLNGTSETSSVTVRLGGLRDCAGVKSYSTYELDLDPGASQPKRWPVGQSASFPCDIYLAGPTYGNYQGITTRGHACTQGLSIDHEGRFPIGDGGGLVPWKPPLPMTAKSPQRLFCQMKWDAWGKSRISGTAYMLALTYRHTGRRYWPAKLELSHAVWCPAAGQETPFASAITYGEFRATLFGSPRPLVDGTVPASAFRDFSGDRHVYRQRLRPTSQACWLGYSDGDPTGVDKPFEVHWGEPDR